MRVFPWPGAGKISGNLFEDRSWLLPPNYLDNANENKTENEPKIVTRVISPKPPIKEEEPKTNEQSTENAVGDQVGPFCKSQEEKKEQNKVQQQKMPPNPKLQKLAGQKITYPEIEHDKSQAAMGKMERLNSKYNLNYFSDSELDSESDEGEQYHHEHGYETLI